MKKETLTLKNHTKIPYRSDSIWTVHEQKLIREYSKQYEIERR